MMSKTRRPTRPISGILLLDKPQGISSNNALQQVRRLYQAEKAGHTGSLDPLATGLLPICFGQATKLCGYLLDSDKRYSVRAKLGARTDTGDAEGEVIQTSDPSGLTRAQVDAVLPRFTGDIRQVPPMYSALKHQGRRLYELAREGQEIERAPRALKIHELRLTDFEPGYFELDVHCSKGTYIRSLVEDLATSLGQCAHVVALRRLESAPFYQPHMHDLATLEAAARQGLTALDALLLPALSAVSDWQRVAVDASQATRLSQGQAIEIPVPAQAGRVAVVDESGALLGVAEASEQGNLAPKRWLS